MKRTIEEAKILIETLLPMQEEGEIFPCPRCGHDRMNPKAVRNALSRRADVYICNECGMEDMALAYNDENERTQRIQNRLLELYMGVINENK